jgi:hypothetical protein
VDTLRGASVFCGSILLDCICSRGSDLASSLRNLYGVRAVHLAKVTFMRGVVWASLFTMLSVSAQAQTPPKFLCQISSDKLTLRVTITNPYDQPTHCQVNCHLSGSAPGSTFSSSCGKTVPAKAGDFLLCEQQLPGKRPYGVVDASSNAECIKPLTDADKQKEDEDDDALIKKLEKEGLDMLKRLQKGN